MNDPICLVGETTSLEQWRPGRAQTLLSVKDHWHGNKAQMSPYFTFSWGQGGERGS